MKEGLPYRRRNTSISLLVTFALGIGIGFSLCFAILKSDGVPSFGDAATGGAGGAGSNSGTEGEGLIAPGALVPDPPPDPSSADTDGLWPAEHLMVGISGDSLAPDEHAMLAEFKPGAVILRAENLRFGVQVQQLIGQIKQAAGLGMGRTDPPLVFLAAEDGLAANPFDLDKLQAPAALAAAGNRPRAQEMGRRYAAVARSCGVAGVFAPRLDLYVAGLSHPGLEAQSYGSTPDCVAGIGLAVAEGLLEGGLLPLPKHYPGVGAAQIQETGSVAVLERDRVKLAEHFFPFAEAADRGYPGLLAAHVAVPALDNSPAMPPAPLSPALIRGILRERWHYDGVVVADDITQDPMTRGLFWGQVVVDALGAGCDVVIVQEAKRDRVQEICKFLVDEATGVSAERLAESKARIALWRTQLFQYDRAVAGLPPVSTGSTTSLPPGPAPQPSGTQLVMHRIEQGETLAGIAQQYGVRTRDLMAWNSLEDSTIKYGFNLKVYTPEPPEPAPETETPAPEPAPETETPAPAPSGLPPEGGATAEEGEALEASPDDVPEDAVAPEGEDPETEEGDPAPEPEAAETAGTDGEGAAEDDGSDPPEADAVAPKEDATAGEETVVPEAGAAPPEEEVTAGEESVVPEADAAPPEEEVTAGEESVVPEADTAPSENDESTDSATDVPEASAG